MVSKLSNALQIGDVSVAIDDSIDAVVMKKTGFDGLIFLVVERAIKNLAVLDFGTNGMIEGVSDSLDTSQLRRTFIPNERALNEALTALSLDITTKIDGIEHLLQSITQDLTQAKSDITSLSSSLTQAQSDITQTKSDVSTMKGQIATLWSAVFPTG
jgi:hypothetical protein